MVRKIGGGNSGVRWSGKIEVDVEAPQVARLLAPDLVDLPVREDLPAGRLLDVRQRQEAGRQQAPLADLVGRSSRRGCPRSRPRELDAHAALHRLAPARHHHPRIGRSDRS